MSLSRALVFTLKEEGGYVNHPKDPGGATNKGITQAVYNRYRADSGQPLQSVRAITDDEVYRIYESSYWKDGKCPQLNEWSSRVAVAHFDACVNTGIRQAARFLQRALQVNDDGVIGPVTLGTYKKADKDLLLVRMIEQRENFHLDLVVNRTSQFIPFLKGWMFRIRRLRKEVGVICA